MFKMCYGKKVGIEIKISLCFNNISVGKEPQSTNTRQYIYQSENGAYD